MRFAEQSIYAAENLLPLNLVPVLFHAAPFRLRLELCLAAPIEFQKKMVAMSVHATVLPFNV